MSMNHIISLLNSENLSNHIMKVKEGYLCL